MYKYVICILLAIMMSSCSLLQVRRPVIEQGNIITEQEAARLHKGMSPGEVKEIMGTPVLVNLFTANRIEYVYTIKVRTNPREVKRLTLIFSHGRLQEIRRNF